MPLTDEQFKDSEQRRKLATFVMDQQVDDWNDLYAAVGRAANGHWSIEAERLVERIRRSARLVGPIDWWPLPWALVRQGVWAQMYADQPGIEPVEMPPLEVFENTNRLMERHLDPVMLERCMMTFGALQEYDQRRKVSDR